MTVREGVGPGHRILGRYEIVRHVATGGMGTVWEARDLVLEQTVALKHVHPRGGAQSDRDRTLREARFAAQLRGHRHVVSIYDVQEVDGDVWLVLEYLPSRSLADITANGEMLPIGEVARIGAAVADALSAAHERGITHRDVKPGNVLLSVPAGEVKLTDFGISHAEGEQPYTANDVVSGTPAYMAREVARGDGETSASDVFSLGATLYKAVEGQPPFGHDPNQLRMLQRVAHGYVEPPRRAGAFGPLLMRLLEFDPNQRPDAAEARRLLEDFGRAQAAGYPPSDPSRDRPGTGPGMGPAGPWPGPGPWPTPPYGPPTGGPSGPTPPRRRRGRLALLLSGVAVVVVAGIVAATLAVVNRPDPRAVPDLPTSVNPIALTGDPKAANPCLLLDPLVMERFGTPTKVGTGSAIGQCAVSNVKPDQKSLVAEAYYSSSSAEGNLTGAPRQSLGGLTIVRKGMSADSCFTYILLSDESQVVVKTHYEDYHTEPAPTLCAANDVATAVAVHKLATDGITYTPGWQAGVSLFDQNACRLVDDALGQVPGLQTGQRVGSPNGAYCFIGPQTAGTPYMLVTLGLENRGNIAALNFGKPGTIDGKPSFTGTSAAVSGNPNSCDVYVEHRTNFDGGASGPSEYILISLEGPASYDDLCKQATGVAAAAERTASS